MTRGELAAVMAAGLTRAADRLLYEATTPWELDAAMTDFGFATGICAAQDDLGLDVARTRCGPHATPVLPRMISEGRLGRCVGVGWYRYPGGGGAVEDPLVEDLLREEAWFGGIQRVQMTDGEMVIHLIAGALGAVLSAKSAGVHADQVDEASIAALGFPADKGGLLSHARRLEEGRLQAAMVRLGGDVDLVHL
ncbi:hypothetical protein So717_14840 [Roseobacter cerasinus]|uniref:3-hydroxyacyl-CoA dehydrogenase C-terminal domain-containing protein n=1 Tax=Roseobacter cerasinus TaxID=2602289 RepID=A0A640VRK3_9RHOB|nr:3-hydroxyacyl-CoA dehydrogenase family protein [Roseobacter cerasinus]GFE49731.1 hypothetical protein So717_14840 [Roseobacter cerasinus]